MSAAPDLWEVRREYARLCLDWAEWLLSSGRDPVSPLDRARRVTDEALKKWPYRLEARALRAWVLALEAERAPTAGRAGLRRQALEELDAALRDNSNLVPAWQTRRERLRGLVERQR